MTAIEEALQIVGWPQEYMDSIAGNFGSSVALAGLASCLTSKLQEEQPDVWLNTYVGGATLGFKRGRIQMWKEQGEDRDVNIILLIIESGVLKSE